MKKITFALAIVTAFAATNFVQADETTGQALATWSAVAKKDSESKLVVTPIGNLNFQYAEGSKGFNSQNGMFDVAVTGDNTATSFKLTSRLVSNTLTQLNTSGSTLTVGARYNGQVIGTKVPTLLIDTASHHNLGGGLSALSSTNSKAVTRTNAQDQFVFRIIGATIDGSTNVIDYSKLPEGIWVGNVSVEFDATWTNG